MQINKRTSKLLVSFLILTLTWFTDVTNIFAKEDPVTLLQNIADHMIAGLRANKATLRTKPQTVYSLAYKYVVPYADLPEMSKRVVPSRVWQSASANQRMQFQKEFTRLLIRTYASGLASYEDQVVKFYPVRGKSGQTVQVSSQIQSSHSQPINVTYRLVDANGRWKLVDMSVEGVSMLDSFRSQFADILSQGNMDSLLNRLSIHNRGRR
jgi:phospholipid transport system substrate-binding protein